MTDDHLQGKLEGLHYKYPTEGDWTPGHSLLLQKLGTSPTFRLSQWHHTYLNLFALNDHFHSKTCKFLHKDSLEKKEEVKILQANLSIPPTFHMGPILASIQFKRNCQSRFSRNLLQRTFRNWILKGSNRADLFSELIPISNRSNEIDEYVSI